jgi:hypothetical protein
MSLHDSDRSALESIEHELYDPRAKPVEAHIHQARAKRELNLPTSWGGDDPIIVKGEEDTRFSFGAKLLLFSTILLFAALAFSAWRVFSLRNVVSAANIDMSGDITPYIEGGEATPLVLTLRNRNTADLQSASVTLLYKQGTGSQDEQEKVQERRELGTIKPNEYKKQDFSVTLYGSEAETRDLIIKLEYKVAGSNAVFSKVLSTRVVLRAPPVSVAIQGPDKLSIKQSGTYSFVVTNNSATTSVESVLKLILPNSFTVENTSPKPILRSTSWMIKKLNKGESQTITITGSFDGKQGETGTISAKIGSRGEDSTSIGIVFASAAMDITLRSSPLVLSMMLSSINGGSESIRYDDKATISISYSNGSAQSLEDVSIKLTLSGDAALYGAINPTSGYYDSVQKTITFDKATLPDLAILPPNSQGTVQIVIPIVQRGVNSPSLTATVVGSASTRSSDDVVTTVTKTWGVQGSATLEAHTQYKSSPFPNTGPIPPRPNEDTTYTAHLKVSAQNTLSASRVSFTLPAYVTWRGVTSNSGAVTYNSKTRTVTWEIGRLEQNTTSSVDIGLSVKPSQSHVNQAPAITSGIILNADEEISRAHLQTTLSPLSTAVYNESWPENPSLVVSGN